MVFTCPVCENSEYDELDGFFFCRVCGQQSQEIHTQEVTENFDTGYSEIGRRITEAKPKTCQKKFGRPWTIYEAFQCIILAQCDALISLGAKEDLKDVVFMIWANYLSKLQVAFCYDEMVVPKIVLETGRGRQRELHRGSLEEPWNRKRDSSLLLKRTAEDAFDHFEDALTFVDENLLDKKSYLKALRSAEWMDLKKTAAFCCLGIRITNPEILPCQFLRWIYEGKVPFLSTTHLLKKDMFLYGEDYLLFQPVVLKVNTLFAEMQKLTVYLDMKNPSNQTMEFMFDLLIDHLQLPGELKEICGNLYKTVPYRRILKKRSDKRLEFEAVTYIAFALKMLFGLNDDTECLLSEFSEDIQEQLKESGVNVFVWSKWRRQQTDRCRQEYDAYNNMKHNVLFSDSHFNYQHLDKMLDSYDALMSVQGDDDCNLLKKTLKTTLQKIEDDDKGITPEPTAKDAMKDEARSDFTESTLIHITDFHVFKSKYKDAMHHNSWKHLIMKHKKICQNMTVTTFDCTNETAMHVTRPNSHLWLLELLSKHVGCHVVKLDITLSKLQSLFEKKLSEETPS